MNKRNLPDFLKKQNQAKESTESVWDDGGHWRQDLPG